MFDDIPRIDIVRANRAVGIRVNATFAWVGTDRLRQKVYLLVDEPDSSRAAQTLSFAILCVIVVYGAVAFPLRIGKSSRVAKYPPEFIFTLGFV